METRHVAYMVDADLQVAQITQGERTAVNTVIFKRAGVRLVAD